MMPYQIKPSTLLADGTVATEPVPHEAQVALERWAEKHTDELVDVLAPFGLHPYDIAAPVDRKVI